MDIIKVLLEDDQWQVENLVDLKEALNHEQRIRLFQVMQSYGGIMEGEEVREELREHSDIADISGG